MDAYDYCCRRVMPRTLGVLRSWQDEEAVRAGQDGQVSF